MGGDITLVENTLFGVVDKVARSIDRLRTFEPPEGYYLAFSGGKDSQCIYHLAKEAGVKFDAHYHITTLDPPELIYFIRENYPDVEFDTPPTTMWRLIPQKGLPTRLKRYCCAILKEGNGVDRTCITGVRWGESNNRAKNRNAFEVLGKTRQENMLFSDNNEDRKMFENCVLKGKRIVNPIIDWSTDDVWEYIRSRKLKYCKLYDEGFNRLGCIGCPMSGQKGMTKEFERWPKYEANYKKAIEKFIPGYIERCKKKGVEPLYTTVDDWFNWWIYGKDESEEYEGQIEIDDSE